jgi:hypothetical protein
MHMFHSIVIGKRSKDYERNMDMLSTAKSPTTPFPCFIVFRYDQASEETGCSVDGPFTSNLACSIS